MKPILFLLKSENHSPIPAGAHWITVRPPGHDKGQPILVVDQPDGSVKVVGGAGGALNHMRFRPKAQGQDHKQAAIERQKALREKRKAQIAADKEAGVHEQKQAARAQLLNERRKSEKEFIHAVADHMGWDKSQLEFDRSKFEHLSDKAVDKLERQHHAGLMQKAKEVAVQQRSWLVSDQEARAEAGLGEIPIHSEDSFQLSAQDLDPVRPKGGGLGFSPEYAERAAEQGATPEELAQEANAVKQADMTPEKRQAALRRGELAQQIKAELAGVKGPELPVVKQKIDDAKKAAAILAAQKRMALQAKAFKEANKKVDEGQTFEPKALALDTEDASQVAEAVKRDIENDLRTISTASFIEHANRHGTREEMAGHIATGAFHSINSLALSVSGDALIDRSVVDVLGVDGAAKVLARRLASSMSPEDFKHVVDGMEDYHRHHYVETAAAAIKQADEAMAAVKDINLSDATDLETAQALNAKRRDAIEAARRVMGSAMGEMEANASLVAELKAGVRSDSLQVPMGQLTPDAIIQQARAIGLKKGQYAIERAGAESFLTVTPEGLDALSKPFSRDDLMQVQRNLDIMSGKYDEENWLPLGFANRPDLAMHVEPGVAPSLAKPFEPSADIEQSLRDYIGGRIADGDAPLDILRDVQSYEFSQRSGVDGTTYIKALNAVAPLKGEDGEMRPIESMRGVFERYADDFVERHYGGQRQPLHRQSFELDDHAVESLHRALADHPDGLVAFKPIGELTHRDKRTLREFFYKHIARETQEAADVRMELERLLEDEPEKHTIDMFGTESVSPDWTNWDNRCKKLMDKRRSMSLLWDDYHKALFGREKAYESVQDLIKSNLSKQFAEHYAKLKPESALKVGKTVIRNNVSHLMAVDPKASAARVAQEREMIDDLRERTSTGQYAAGSVKEKLDDYRQQREAFEQSQLGMFGSEELFGGGGDNAPAKPKEYKLDADERFTLGHVAERQIAGMMSVVGKNFKQGQKLKLWKASMSGKFIAQQRAIKMIDANKRVVLGYGAGCVDGATMLTCERTGATKSVYAWWQSGLLPYVKAVDKDGNITIAQASDVFIKGYEEMFLVETAAGASIAVTAGHRFLTRSGWKKLSEIADGEEIAHFGRVSRHQDDAVLLAKTQTCHSAVYGTLPLDACGRVPLASTLVPSGENCSPPSVLSPVGELFLYAHGSTACRVASSGLPQSLSGLPVSNSERDQSVLRVSDPHSMRKPQDCRGDCSVCCRQCGEQPRYPLEDGQVSVPSQDGAQAHTLSPVLSDDLGQERGHSHACQSSCHHAKQHSADLSAHRQDGEECPCVSCGSELSLCSPQAGPQSLTSGFASCGKGRTEFHEKSCPVACSGLAWHSPVVRRTSLRCRIVFDITVPVHQNYIAHGVVNHNSGKTGIMLGAFSHLHGQGKVKRAAMLVPSIVQGQFGGEALRYLEPGKFKWHAEPGASREERIAAYKDPNTHFVVMTHQSFRDDMVHLGAAHAGIEPSEMVDRLKGMKPHERKAWIAGVMEREGINFDATMVDEAHETVNRYGKQDSTLSNVVDALSDHTPYYVYASGDPVKNDVSEAADVMAKMDRQRYGDKAAFMRRYGADNPAARSALKREMARHMISNVIAPDVQARRDTRIVPLSEGQKRALSDLDKHFSKARFARMAGKVDVAACKAISPAAFDGVPEKDHEAVAREVQSVLGTIKSSARRRIINEHPDNAKIDETIKEIRSRKGKQGVVFAHNLGAVNMLKQRLEAEGIRVVTITGGDSSQEKDRKRQLFTPESGEAQADVMIASDAAAVGMNLQSGQYLIQHDVPDTAKTHGQRNARIHRLGQKQNVDLIDMVADHPDEHRARERLLKKYELRELMLSPQEGLDDTGIGHFIAQRRAEAAQTQGGLF